MNWVETSVLVMLGFFASIYLVLVFLTSPRMGGRGKQIHRSYRPASGASGFDSLRPHKLAGVRDEDLTEQIRNRLRLRPGLSGVEVAVLEGRVRLTGKVGNVDERELAGNVARSVPQVVTVVNEVRVRFGEAVA